MIRIFFLIGISFLFQDHSKKKTEFTTLVYPPDRHAPIHKATSVHLFAMMAVIGRTDVTPNDPQGLAVTRLSATDKPEDRNDDDDLTAYGLNSGQNNIIYNISMEGLDVYDGKTPKQRLNHPMGITCTTDGAVYIADTENHRIVKLINSSGHLSFVNSFGKKGSKEGQFNNPTGIACDLTGRLYIADRENDRIQITDSTGKILSVIGEKSDSNFTKLFKPASISLIDPSDTYNYYHTGFIIVTDLNDSRIQKFSLDGKFLGGIQPGEYGFEKVKLTSSAIDFYGNIWVTDAHNHTIHKFTKDLIYITSFGTPGQGEREFLEPRSIAIWKRFGQVFIADKASAQYYHIGTDILNFKISQVDTSIHFDFFLTETSKVTAKILDENNQFVASLVWNKIHDLGQQTLVWNRYGSENPEFFSYFKKMRALKNQDSTVVTYPQLPSGLYKIVVEAKTTYVYNRYFTKKIEIEFTF